MTSDRQTSLGEVAEFINGYGFTERHWEDVGLPIIRIQNLTNTSKPFNKTSFNPGKKFIVKNGDILVSWSATLDVFEWQGADAYLNQHIFLVKPNLAVIDKSYLVHVLRQAITSMLRHTRGSTMKHINRGDFLGTIVPFPKLEEQKRIAAILDKAGNLRTKRKQTIQLLDDFIHATFISLFGDPVVNDKKWPEKKISEFSVITTGNTPSRDDESNFGSAIEWIKSDNINTPNHFLTSATEYLSEKGLSIGRTVPAGSTLMTCIAGSPSCIGNVAMTDRTVAFNQQINAMTPNSDVTPEFLYCLMLFSKKRIQASSTNSMKGMISKGVLGQIRLVWPPKHLQHKFAENFRKVIAIRNRMHQFESDLLFSALQSKYLSKIIPISKNSP